MEKGMRLKCLQILSSASALLISDPLTLREILDGLPHTAVERPGVSGTLERQPALPVVHPPMVESGGGFSVDQVLLQKALQDRLHSKHGYHTDSILKERKKKHTRAR